MAGSPKSSCSCRSAEQPMQCIVGSLIHPTGFHAAACARRRLTTPFCPPARSPAAPRLLHGTSAAAAYSCGAHLLVAHVPRGWLAPGMLTTQVQLIITY